MKQRIFRLIADLRFSIFILLLISVCSVIGTIIEQDQSIESYKINYPLTTPVFGVFTWNSILRFGFDHVYQTWWFFLLIFLFGLSLISCTFLQQLPSLRIARRCQFFRTIPQFYQLKISTILNRLNLKKILLRIQKKNYSIFQQKNILYCYQGISGRIAPILVHLSMILILLGTIVGSLFGFKAQEIVPKTESFQIQNVFSNGQLTRIPNLSARINDFWITYTNTQTISQFYSDISILNNQGNEIHRKTISVNYPLVYQNIYYYQTDWNLIGVRFQNLDHQSVEWPLTSIASKSNKLWVTYVSNPLSFPQGILILVDNLEGYCSIYTPTGKFLGNLELHEIDTFDRKIILSDILSSTGVQIKQDPGIPLIYTGFFFLIFSILFSYITYSQIWMIQKNGKIFLGGTTNRAIFDFELDFFQFIK